VNEPEPEQVNEHMGVNAQVNVHVLGHGLVLDQA
jgi:hypothetical protein